VSCAAAPLHGLPGWLGMIEPHPMEMLVAAFAMEDSEETLLVSCIRRVGEEGRYMVIESSFNPV
jgi:hypothetical protein